MKPRYFFYGFLLLLFGAPLWLYITWKLRTEQSISIVIVDKTVASFPAKEHISLFWALKNKKITKPDGKFYDPNTDYFGFFPKENKQYDINGLEKLSDSDLTKLAIKSDLLYLADCYGIYDYDLNETTPDINAQKIYGGLSRQDIYLLSEMKRLNKKIIAEFNCMNSPSSREFRLDFQKLFSIRWSGWIGKFYYDLGIENGEIPLYVLNNYLKENGKPWPYKGAGILLLHENGKYVVLRDRIELNGSLPKIVTNATFRKKYNLPKEIQYPFWFEINQTSRKNEVISVFQLPTNARGDSLLTSQNLPKVFPASIANNENGQHFFYFCADFADNPIDYDLAVLANLEWLKTFSANNQDKSKREIFFYKYYLPMLSSILEK